MLWIAFIAFETTAECDAFVEANRPNTDLDVQCILYEPTKPPVRPKPRPGKENQNENSKRP